MDLFEYDRERGVRLLCGVDEAGRGPLAGDVYAAAVILPEGADLPGLNDSKKLTEKKREALYDKIIGQAVSYCIASASAEEIDGINILNATFLAMKRAVEGLSIPPEYVLIDGNRLPKDFNVPCECVIKGDATSASIAAASILAKVARDRYMKEIASQYPEYGFEKHKGYGTKDHYRAISEHGVLPIHRKTFLKNLTGEKPANAHLTGAQGEQVAAKYLESKGCEVISRNYHSSYGEIDLIVKDGEYLVFAEVKTRKPDALVSPAEAVTPQKQKKIIRTALMFLSENGMSLQPRFDVIEVVKDGEKFKVRRIENAFTADGVENAF